MTENMIKGYGLRNEYCGNTVYIKDAGFIIDWMEGDFECYDEEEQNEILGGGEFVIPKVDEIKSIPVGEQKKFINGHFTVKCVCKPQSWWDELPEFDGC